MSHQIRINKGELLGVERVKMNHMLSYLYGRVVSHEARIAELEAGMDELIILLRDSQAQLNEALKINNLHMEVITGERFTEEDIEE